MQLKSKRQPQIGGMFLRHTSAKDPQLFTSVKPQITQSETPQDFGKQAINLKEKEGGSTSHHENGNLTTRRCHTMRAPN